MNDITIDRLLLEVPKLSVLFFSSPVRAGLKGASMPNGSASSTGHLEKEVQRLNEQVRWLSWYFS
jgi:hypothetical protein